jgi:hypothetical protein
MAQIRAAAERSVAASPEHVYRILADYREHHPKILPPAFSNFRVEEGGVGAGTVINFDLKLGGQSHTYRQRVAEPEPGRVLTETDMSTGATTTFTVTPEGDGSRVRIETVYEGDGGIRGLIEKLLAPLLLKRLYADELKRLDRHATGT